MHGPRDWRCSSIKCHSFSFLRWQSWILAFGCPKAHHHRECFAPCERIPRATPHTCVSMENLNIWSRKIHESWGFRLFLSIFWFFKLSMVLGCSGYQSRLLGLISCPGLISNRSGLKFSSYSNFPVHMMFVCRPCRQIFAGARNLPELILSP